MENLVLAFNVVLPLFICIVLGYFLRCIGMLPENVQKSLNKLCFKVFLPIYLFKNLYTTDLQASFDGKLIAFAGIGLVVLWGVLMAVIPLVEKDNARRGVVIQGIFRANFALYGLPVAESLLGDGGNMGPTSLLVGFTVPIFNVLAVVTLETFRGGRPSAAKMLRGIATNPLIIASVLGALANLSGLRLPEAVMESVSDLGGVATPLSLVSLGASFTFSSVRGYVKPLAITVSGRLVIGPLVMVTLAALLGFRNEYLIPLMIIFAAPTAVSSYPMAQQMGGDDKLAASIVVFTTALSILTIFLWIFVLKTLGLI